MLSVYWCEMSYNFVLTGKEPILQAEFNPPIYLEEDAQYVMGLVNFEAYNNIQNIYDGCNKFYYGKEVIVIPNGCYQIKDINDYIRAQVARNVIINITANNNTLRTHIKSTVPINFEPKDSIANLLGFKNKSLPLSHKPHISDYTANITKVNTVLINCNITTGSYINGEPEHIAYAFFPKVPPGFKIIESPDHVMYLPINAKIITNLVVIIQDQDREIINFNNETITIGFHLKKV